MHNAVASEGAKKWRWVHRHVIYVPSVKNQYKRVVFGYMVIYSHL